MNVPFNNNPLSTADVRPDVVRHSVPERERISVPPLWQETGAESERDDQFVTQDGSTKIE